MTKIEKLEGNIRKWLEDYGYLVSKKSDEKSDFHFVVSNFVKKESYVNISKPKSMNIITIGTSMQNPSDMLEKFLSVKNLERRKFFKILQGELSRFKVEHRFIPDDILPERFIIFDSIQTDGLTAIAFMNSFKSVKFATLFLIWTISQKFAYDDNQNAIPIATNSQTPYA